MKKNLIFGGFLAVFAFSLAYAFVGTLDHGMTETEIMTYVKKEKCQLLKLKSWVFMLVLTMELIHLVQRLCVCLKT